MDVFGSFALVLAFICAVYAFGGGIAAIVTRHPLLVKSTRQSGMAACCLIFLATFSLEYLFFSDNFSIAYVVAHSNRDLAPFYKIAALWAGQEGSLLFWSFLLAIYVFSVLVTYRNKNGELMPYVGVVMAGVQIFFLTLNNFVASPFKVLASPGADGALTLRRARRWQWVDAAAAVSGNGDSPAESVFRVHRVYDSVCVCAGRAAGALPGGEVDSSDAQMDDDCLDVSVHGDFAWRALGLRGAGLGRLLGLGPGGECVASAVADGHGVSALCDDAGKARHDEGLERVAGLHHVPAVHPGDVPDAQRRGQLGSCVRAIQHRDLVCELHRADHLGLPWGLFEESRLSEERESARFDRFSRIEFLVQQFDPAGFVRRGTFRHALPGFFRMDHRQPHQRGRAVL